MILNIKIFDVTGKLVLDPKTREWCKFPYPGHPSGCPNYGQADHCPPKVKILSEVFDLTKPHFFVIVIFDLDKHSKFMKAKHPNWSDAQCKCVLYWQNSVRKALNSSCTKMLASGKGTYFTLVPEAMGLNVFRTCYAIGVDIFKNPQLIVKKIALVGFKKGESL